MAAKADDGSDAAKEILSEQADEDDDQDDDQSSFPFDDLEGFEVVDEVEDQADELLDEVEAQLEQAGVGPMNDSLESTKEEIIEDVEEPPLEVESEKLDYVESGAESKQDVECTEDVDTVNQTDINDGEEMALDQAEQEGEEVEGMGPEEQEDGEVYYVEEEVEQGEVVEENEEVDEEIAEHEGEVEECTEEIEVEEDLEEVEEQIVVIEEGQEEDGEQEDNLAQEDTGEVEATEGQEEPEEDMVEEVIEELEVEDVEYEDDGEDEIQEELVEATEELEEECEDEETEIVEEIEEIHEFEEVEDGVEEVLVTSNEENTTNQEETKMTASVEADDILSKSTRVHVHPVRLSDFKDIALEPSLKKAVCCSLRFFGPRCSRGPGSLEVRFATHEEALEEKRIITKMAASHEKLFKATLIKPGEGPMDWILNEWQKSVQPPGIFDSRCVFVNNVPEFTREEMLRALYPTADSVHLPRNSDGVSHGYAMLEFSSPEEADDIVTSSKNYQTRIGDNILKLTILAKVPTATGTVQISTEDLVQEIISEGRKKENEKSSNGKTKKEQKGNKRANEKRKNKEIKTNQSSQKNTDSKHSTKDLNKKYSNEKTTPSDKEKDTGKQKGKEYNSSKSEDDRRRSSKSLERRSLQKRNDPEFSRRSSGSRDTSKSHISGASGLKHFDPPNSTRSRTSKSPTGRSSATKLTRSNESKKPIRNEQVSASKSYANNNNNKQKPFNKQTPAKQSETSSLNKLTGKPVPTMNTERKAQNKMIQVANPANVIPVQLGRTGHTLKRPTEPSAARPDKRIRKDGPSIGPPVTMSGGTSFGPGYRSGMNRSDQPNRGPMPPQGGMRPVGNFQGPHMNRQPPNSSPQVMSPSMSRPPFPNNNGPQSGNLMMPNTPNRPVDIPNRNQMFMRQGPQQQMHPQQMPQQQMLQQMPQQQMPQQQMMQPQMQSQQIPLQQMPQQQMTQQIPPQQISQQQMPQQHMMQQPMQTPQIPQQQMPQMQQIPPQQRHPQQMQQQQPLQQQQMPSQQQNFGGPNPWPGNQNRNTPDRWERSQTADPREDIHNLRGELLKQLQVLETGNISDASDLSNIALKLKQVQESRVSNHQEQGGYSNPQNLPGNPQQQMNVPQQSPGINPGTFQNLPNQFQSQGNFQNPVHIQQQQAPMQQPDVFRAYPIPAAGLPSGPMGDQPFNNQGNNNPPFGYDRNPGFDDMGMDRRGGLDSYRTSHGFGLNENNMSEKLRRTVCVDNLPMRILYSEVKSFFRHEMFRRGLCAVNDEPVHTIQEVINGRTTMIFQTDEFALRALTLDKVNYKGHILNLRMM